MAITIQFLGAAETVTGSKYLLTVDNTRFLIDCGLFQGSEQLKQRNWAPLPIPAQSVDTVLITHAHLDHVGWLPRLWSQGYRSQVICTSATDEIARLSLADSGRLQEEYAHYANKKGFSRHKPALPLYTENDAREACALFQPQKFGDLFELAAGCSARFLTAGHILGSGFIEFWLPTGQKILFSGDLGRPNQPIIPDPTIVTAADYLLIESTYGDRVHPSENPEDALLKIIQRAQAQKGVILVPAFAIGRTQDLLYYLHNLRKSGRCQEIPIYVDSPMGVDATGIYARHHEDHDLEMEKLESSDSNPLRPAELTLIKSPDQSKALNNLEGPAMIIASSGMATGGRIVHHLAQRLKNPQDIVVFVGFQAEGTLGRDLVEKRSPVNVMGMQIEVRAEIESIGSLSAHADSNEIIQWMRGITTKPKQTFIVHGEPPAQAAIKQRIQNELGFQAVIPKYLETFELH